MERIKYDGCKYCKREVKQYVDPAGRVMTNQWVCTKCKAILDDTEVLVLYR